jgi:Helix-turn-helix domain
MRSLTAQEEATLRTIAARHGFLAERGPHAREGSASRLMDALLADELVTIACTPGERQRLIGWLERAPSQFVPPGVAGVVHALAAQLRTSLPATANGATPRSPAKHVSGTTRRRLTSDEAAHFLKLSVSRVQELARQGIITGRKDEGHWTFTKSAIVRYQHDRLLEQQARALRSTRPRRRAGRRSSRRHDDDDVTLAWLDRIVAQQRAVEHELGLPFRPPQVQDTLGMGIEEPAGQRTLHVELWLRVENNSSFVHGKKRAREEIERWVLSRYGMHKPDNARADYVLTIPYDSEQELENTVYRDILGEAERLADARHCFIEADVRALDGSDRIW